MSKKNNDLDMSVPMTAEEVEVYTHETGEALALRAELGVLPCESTTASFAPMYAKVDSKGGTITAGKDGAIVLTKGQSTDCIIIGISPRGALKWVKNDQGQNVPTKWRTAQEALDAGEILEFPPRGVEGPKPTASYSRTLIMLTKCAGESNPAFQFTDPTGNEWAILNLEFSGTSYRNNFQSQGNSDGGIMTGLYWHEKHAVPFYQLVYTLSTIQVTSGQFNGYVPKLTMRKKMESNDPTFMAISEAIRVMSPSA